MDARVQAAEGGLMPRTPHVCMRLAARMRPTPSVRTPKARNTAPTYARFIRAFGSFAVGEATDRKQAAGIKVAATGTPIRMIHFKKGESTVASTYRSMTSDRTI